MKQAAPSVMERNMRDVHGPDQAMEKASDFLGKQQNVCMKEKKEQERIHNKKTKKIGRT